MLRFPIFFHEKQLEFAPRYEWALGTRIKHPESTKRAQSIFKALEKDERFQIICPKKIPLKKIRDTHSFELLTLYTAASLLKDDETFYPSVFPQRVNARPDPANLKHAGFYCFDSGTPLNNKTLLAASWSSACAIAAAEVVANKKFRYSYALSRPPGHHATKDTYGGYCYFNNAAMVANDLKKKGRVVILDIDFHHGNGSQEIFYEDPDVLVVSIHGDPRNYFPYFIGFPSEIGKGEGIGRNLNIILPKGTKFTKYAQTLKKQVFPVIKAFEPDFLIVSAGFDTYKLDPIGDFLLETEDYKEMAKMIKGLDFATVILQEGGYYTKDLGANVKSFLSGFL